MAAGSILINKCVCVGGLGRGEESLLLPQSFRASWNIKPPGAEQTAEEHLHEEQEASETPGSAL